MAKSSVTLTFPKGDELVAALKALPPAVFKRVARAANAKAMRPVVQRAKALAPRNTGLLRKSIGVKTKLYPKKLTVATVVGPRYSGDFDTPHKSAKFERETVTKGSGKIRRQIPGKYAHLVEYGHRVAKRGTVLLREGQKLGDAVRNLRFQNAARARRGLAARKLGKSVGFVPAKPFLRPAFDGQREQILSSLRQEYAAAIEREHARSIKKLEKLKGKA
jgi:HK97 gp10 family phage protein